MTIVRYFVIAAVVLTLAGPAHAKRSKWGSGLPSFVSCDMVRDYTSRYTVAELRAMARKWGIRPSALQMAQANQCKRAGS